MYKKILVPVDGSEPSNNALKHAMDIAEKFSSEVTLLAVVSRVMIPIFPDEGFGAAPMTAAKDMAQYQERMRVIYQNVLEEAQEKMKEKHSHLKVNTLLKEGRPSSTIVEIAENEDHDLIVMGSRGIGGITGWILGSTSRRVVDSCTKPILIVK
jgi:nucleotide-binding universal stress UspA family protein